MNDVTEYHHQNHHDHLELASNIHDAARDSIHATNMSGVAGIRETSRVASDLAHDIFSAQLSSAQQHSDSRSATERTAGENRLQSSMDARAILMSQQTLLAELRGDIKDNGILTLKEGCDTREKSAEQFAALQLQACKDHAELSKQHGEIKLQMCKDHADLAAKLAECCCELKQENAETRALVLATDAKRVEADNAALRQELMISRLNGNGPGQGN